MKMKNINTIEKKARSLAFTRRHNPRVYDIHTHTRTGQYVELSIVAANFKELMKAAKSFTPFGVYTIMDNSNYSYFIRKPFAY